MNADKLDGATLCPVCPHSCLLLEGETGFCRARAARDGSVHPLRYGAYSALAFDPIEKKPFRHFHPGSGILSIGGYGCNMRCWFCQNSEISQCAPLPEAPCISPDALIAEALALRAKGNIGVAYTYNEPGIAYEFVRDAAMLAKEHGLLNAIITNGYLQAAVWHTLLTSMDACNIDLKCFTRQGYERLSGNLPTVQRSIRQAVEQAHVEITTLVVPGLSDGIEDMRKEAQWIASLSPDIPLHISRYFPRYQAREPQTELCVLSRLADAAKEHLRFVYVGNV